MDKIRHDDNVTPAIITTLIFETHNLKNNYLSQRILSKKRVMPWPGVWVTTVWIKTSNTCMPPASISLLYYKGTLANFKIVLL